MVVVVAPIVAEVFVRGAVMQALRRHWSVSAAVAESSAVFGAHPLPTDAFPGAGTGRCDVRHRGRAHRSAWCCDRDAREFTATTFVTLALLR